MRLPTKPVVIDEVHEAIGAYVWDGNKRVRILDLLWAVNERDEVRIARFKGVSEDGTEYNYDQTDGFKRIAHTTSELAGAYCRDKEGRRFLIEEMTYTLTEDGSLTPLTMSGTSQDGEAFSFYLQQTHVCCRAMQVMRCVQGTCQGTGCNGPTSCACSPGGTGQSCELETYWDCRGKCGPAFNCPDQDQDTCQESGSGTPPTCVCD